jgi:hypothetical protein
MLTAAATQDDATAGTTVEKGDSPAHFLAPSFVHVLWELWLGNAALHHSDLSSLAQSVQHSLQLS